MAVVSKDIPLLFPETEIENIRFDRDAAGNSRIAGAGTSVAHPSKAYFDVDGSTSKHEKKMRPFLTIHHPSSAKRYYEQGLWRDETFYGLLARHASERAGSIALQDGRHQLTWAQLREWVDGVAASLREFGLVGGDRVSIWMSNRVETVVMFLACGREGLACNPSLHRTHTCGEVVDLLSSLSARALLTESGWGADRSRVDFEASLVGIPSLKVVYTLETFPRPAANATPPCTDPDKIAYLAFTSGTTGSPKCVMHSDNTLLANARAFLTMYRRGRADSIG